MAARRQGPGRASRPKSPRRGGSDATVRLATPTGAIAVAWPKPGTDKVKELQRQAIRWTHVVRNRARWIGTPSLAKQQDENARAFLASLGIKGAQREQLALAGNVRVSILYTEEQHGWEARILPWEFLLSAGTRDLRTGSLVVSRSLLQERRAARRHAYRKVLFVESSPGRLSQDWDFKDERRLVKQYAGKDAKQFELLESPTRAQLAAAAKKFHPDVVHLAGFDTHQGLELLREPRAEDAPDGYLLAGAGGVEPVAAFDLATAVTAGGSAPSLVFCNIWNSAARIAPLLIAAGVGSAIGFQDGIDDALAELFLGNFYRALGETQDLDVAFEEAWQSLLTQPKPTRATGIVVWSGASETAPAAAVSTHATSRVREQTAVSPETVEPGKALDLFAITVEPEPRFSYGLLHNNRDLFRRFLIRNLSAGPLAGVQVFVELHSNEGTYPYRQSFNIDDTVLDLSPQVRIALTSDLARTLDEMLRTSLYVQINWGAHEIFRQTFPVTMAPVDQWADTDNDRVFLPSFIFPRDRAVTTVIKSAEHFVTTLRDDPTAGFDGYQSIDPELANPAQFVDSQVQALWYSVVYRVPVSYINPPPTYAVSSQRIRTPSEIVAGGFGTCIDLALMLASCLEAVEIHPVIFLLEDHAFPGYWRTEAGRDTFRRRVASSASDSEGGANGRGDAATATRRPPPPWCFSAPALSEIRRAIERRQLVPLESVGLTGRWSLADAVEEGRTYFEKKEEGRFLMMLDVVTAREAGVTPLPLGPRLQ